MKAKRGTARANAIGQLCVAHRKVCNALHTTLPREQQPRRRPGDQHKPKLTFT